MKTSIYNYEFKNGTITITKGITTKFDWEVSVKLNDGFICLNKTKFLTRKEALGVTWELLDKYKLV